MTTSHDMKVSM